MEGRPNAKTKSQYQELFVENKKQSDNLSTKLEKKRKS